MKHTLLLPYKCASVKYCKTAKIITFISLDVCPLNTPQNIFFFQDTCIIYVSRNVNAHCHTKFPQTYILLIAWNELNSEVDLYLYLYNASCSRSIRDISNQLLVPKYQWI